MTTSYEVTYPRATLPGLGGIGDRKAGQMDIFRFYVSGHSPIISRIDRNRLIDVDRHGLLYRHYIYD